MKIAVCAAILLILGAGILFGVLRARKKSLSTAISRLILTLAALILAILACVFLSRFLSGRILAALTAGIPELAETVGHASEIEGVLLAFCSAGIALVLFLILYPIALPLCRIAVKPLSRLLDRLIPALSEPESEPKAPAEAPATPAATPGSGTKGKHLRLAIRLAVGGLCGLILSVTLLSPLTGLLRIAGDALALSSAIERKEHPDAEQPFDSLIEVCDALPVRTVGWLGGTPVCRVLTVSRYDGVRIDPITECDLMSDLADYLNDPAEHKGRFSTYSKTVGKSAILNQVLPDLLEGMFDGWASGRAAMGITPPQFVKDGFEDGMLERKHLTKDALARSMTAVLDLSAYILDNGGLSDSDLDRLTADEDRLSEFYACIIGAPPLHGFLRSFLTFGIGSMADGWDGSEPVLSGDFSQDGAEIEREARALAHATVLMANFRQGYSLEPEHLEDTLNQLGQVLDDFRQTDLIGQDGLQQMAENLLRSESVQSALNYDSQKTEEAIEQIRRDSEFRDYADLLSELVEK